MPQRSSFKAGRQARKHPSPRSRLTARSSGLICLRPGAQSNASVLRASRGDPANPGALQQQQQQHERSAVADDRGRTPSGHRAPQRGRPRDDVQSSALRRKHFEASVFDKTTTDETKKLPKRDLCNALFPSSCTGQQQTLCCRSLIVHMKCKVNQTGAQCTNDDRPELLAKRVIIKIIRF